MMPIKKIKKFKNEIEKLTPEQTDELNKKAIKALSTDRVTSPKEQMEMEVVKLVNGKITIPIKHELTKEKRKLVIKTPYSSCVQILCKDDFTISIQQWFRHKGIDKPFIPEGLIDIDGERYIVMEQM